MLPSKVLLLEGHDGQTWNDHMHNCVSHHLLHNDGQLNMFLVVIPIELCCMLCGEFMEVASMLICD